VSKEINKSKMVFIPEFINKKVTTPEGSTKYVQAFYRERMQN